MFLHIILVCCSDDYYCVIKVLPALALPAAAVGQSSQPVDMTVQLHRMGGREGGVCALLIHLTTN